MERAAALEREAERSRQIERANKLLFVNTERVQRLHSK